ncbi:homoserine dehydrogenase [Ornithinimicrobium sp. INDO-MA30-4]|uniref:homoserine dehydrogenase n=1 Tax=Ornithinimicrobium sp. INDO-MA30-4 TaxID=2908651 RepID=UPI001F433D93|nr:homoserine dehydrogenase [Ornithinimicrobium sp. INDO-MA30-4]UJH70630.1 homoserine dehydrogenase [Ornithinimicrobium sp. INDO-MA30-4]
MTQAPIRVALLGCGTVGSSVARLMSERADLYEARLGRRLVLTGIAVRNLSTQRDLSAANAELLTDDAASVLADADVVIEVMGGLEPAASLMSEAFANGAHVVSANKQLIAHRGAELHEAAANAGVELKYEAAVMAAVPVLRAIGESLPGDEVKTISGIVNGSTNYVLDLVSRLGVPFEDAVRQAGELGFLEADPTEDLQGIDAAAKIVILARTAWRIDASMDDVHLQGIADLSDADFDQAQAAGQVIKLVATANATGSARAPRVELSVRPVPLPIDHPLAGIREGNNALMIETMSAGPLLMTGAGAGGDATASAILGDLMDVARQVN